MRLLPLATALIFMLSPLAAAAQDSSWPHYGNDAGGTRYAPAAQVTKANVRDLEIVWEVKHGDVIEHDAGLSTTSAFEATPILVDGTLYVCTPFNRVLALDPQTGSERWAYDPKVDITQNWSNQLTCRGVASWRDAAAPADAACRHRILTNTVDARLVALDAATGRPCAGFGDDGTVDLNPGVGEQAWRGEYSVTSAPTLAGDLVVVGSAVGDNARIEAPSGVVRAYDVRTGALAWAWDLAPPDAEGLARAEGTGYVLSTPNVWAPMSYDAARDLLFVPTGNPTPDYASGHRQGLDHHGSSTVALRGATGEVVWSFQTVHHDLWDFDVPAQPTLFGLRRGGEELPAVVQPTKMGTLFFFHRETGAPLFPIEERPVPTDAAPEGYVVSPTQPFPVKPPPLVRHSLTPDDAWGFTPYDRGVCRDKIAALRFDGIFTPPSEQGTLMVPGNAGGSNWGGVAVDPERQILVANTQDLPWAVQLIPRAEFPGPSGREFGVEYAPQTGTPYGMSRRILDSPFGVPCNPPPWGELHGVDLASGEIRWSVPLGTLRDLVPLLPITYRIGVPNLGGPLVTGGGLVFIAATTDSYLRAFDIETGEELWEGRLPAGGQATPMTYLAGGRQYVVIAAGGYGRGPMQMGDSIVAFALPEND
jgi:quinoprotein glucose dehydrogenase